MKLATTWFTRLMVLLLIGIFGSPAVYAAPAKGTVKYQAIERLPPEYPEEAIKTGMTGWVIVEFTITDQGTVSGPVAIDNCAWIKTDPSQGRCEGSPNAIFDAAAVQAVLNYKYRPTTVDGKPVAANVKNKIIFELTVPTPPAEAAPQP